MLKFQARIFTKTEVALPGTADLLAIGSAHGDVMPEARSVDILMAEKILGHTIYHEKGGAIRERLPDGQTRPLRNFTTDMGAAWELVQALGMTLIPTAGGWFTLVGPKERWTSPADFLRYLQTADFANSGAAVGESAPEDHLRCRGQGARTPPSSGGRKA